MWLVDTEPHAIRITTADGATAAARSGTLTTALLPGFELHVDSLWA